MMECAFCKPLFKIFLIRRRRVLMASVCIFLIILCIVVIIVSSREKRPYRYYAHFGPKFLPTKGEVWPAAQREYKSKTIYFQYFTSTFDVSVIGKSCDLLKSAITRYEKNLIDFERNRNLTEKCPSNTINKNDSKNNLQKLEIWLSSECEHYPHYEMDESYNLTVGRKSLLKSDSIWGILRGLETFAQLFYMTDDYCEVRINKSEIVDFPAYKHRGLLIDTGRHYISLANILKTIEALSINKMNVLHWHLVDDQSFPYQSERFPTLSEKGAYLPSMIYTEADIQEVVEFARDRGVRVIPEIDVPGHTFSWGEAFPGLLTECYANGKVSGRGPLNPTRDETYNFLQQLLQEVQQRFPDEFMHIGGDEVQTQCWESNPDIDKFIKKNNLRIKELQKYFMLNVMKIVPNETKVMVWQEVFDMKALPQQKTFVQVWYWKWVDEMIKILRAGHFVIFSSTWYLDYKKDSILWSDYYKDDPRKMVYQQTKSTAHLANIVGGEACMWGETVDDTNIHTTIWPKASAVAERLWKGLELESGDPLNGQVRARIEEHTCRLRRRGIPAQPPNGPSFCYNAP